MNRIFIIPLFYLLTLFIETTIFAQTNPGARQNSLAHSDVALSKDIFSLYNNPAGLSQLKYRKIGIFYSPSPFGIKELANGYLAFTEPTSIGNFSLGAMDYGFKLYRENKFVIGYSGQFANNLFLGLTAFYHTVNIDRYGNSGQINLSFGAIFLLNQSISLGFSLHNPLRFTDSHINLPTSFNLGVSYIPIENTSINLALLKEINFPLSISFGIEYPIIKYLDIRIGVRNNPNFYSGGIGINYSLFTLNYSVSSHPELGLTHLGGLILTFK